MNSEMNNSIKIQEFIKHCTGPIPDELKFEGWQISGRLHKPIYYWVQQYGDKFIPEDMKFKGWKKYVSRDVYHNSDSEYDPSDD